MATSVLVHGGGHGGWCYADRDADRIGKLVYLDAANPANGQSLVDIAGPLLETVRAVGQVVDGVELVLLPGPIPQYHIVCTATMPTRDPQLMARARAAGRLWEIDTGHDLMMTEPDAVADALLEVASGRR